MPLIHRKPAGNDFPNPFHQAAEFGANSDGNNAPSDTKASQTARGNANVAQYPYPSPNPQVNRGEDARSATSPGNQVDSVPPNSQRGSGGPQTVVQAPQPMSEFSAVSFSATTSSTLPPFSPSSALISSPSTRLTAGDSTLTVPPPNFATHRTSIIPPSLSFLSQTSYVTETPSVSSSRSISYGRSDSPPFQLSPTAVGIIIAIGGTILLGISICILRCGIRQYCYKRRRRKQSAFDFSRSNEKNPSDTGDVERCGGKGLGKGEESPSTIFGGNERTGLTPQPSWTTFHEGDWNRVASPYPLGLLPPPSNLRRVPSVRVHGGAGLGISYRAGYPTHNENNPSRQYAPRNQCFEPPTITITDSSPRQTVPWLPSQAAKSRNGAHATQNQSNSDISSANSYNRVSVYMDPTHGARLVKPPRLTLVNDDPSLSESDAGPRQSGWSSWDDSVGVELGVIIDRKQFPPRRRSRMPTSKGKKGVSTLQVTLAPVQEISDTFDPEALKKPSTSSSKLHPHTSRGAQGQLHRGPSSSPSSPSSLKRQRLTKNSSPRTMKQIPPNQTLYDLPQFEALSPSGNNSIQVASPSSAPPSPAREPHHELHHEMRHELNMLFAKRRSKGTSRWSNSKQNGSAPAAAGATARPSSTIPGALSDTYAYVHAYALSSTESEEIQVRRRLRRSGGKARSPRSPRGSMDGNQLAPAPYSSPSALGSSPAVSDVVGELMIKSYGEEGSMPSPTIFNLSGMRKEKNGRMEVAPLKESTRVNVPLASSSVGLGLAIQKRQQPQRRRHSRISQPTLQQRGSNSRTTNNSAPSTRNPPAPSFSPQSEYSEHPNQSSQGPSRQYPEMESQLHPHPQQHWGGVPSLPPPGMPNLHQMKLMRDMPEYRSPTYSVYGMYRDESKASPAPSLRNLPVQYRHGSSGMVRRGENAKGNGSGSRVATRADVI